MFDFIYNFFGWIIRSFYELFKGTSLAYALALLMFAIIIKIVLFPLGIKQQKNMQKQARLRPRETAIRKKYAGREDQATKQKMQNEVMEMYKEERFNPASGCLPLLIQLPLLIMLYAVVRGPLTYIAQFGASELAVLGKALGPLFNVSTYSIDTSNEIVAISVLRENSTFLTGEAAELIKKLPDLTLFGLDLTATPTFASWLVIIPVLNLLASFFGQSLIRKMSYQPLTETENNAGCSPKMMNIMMPLFSTYIAFQVPAALGLYWIYTNLLGVIQQYILKKMYPTPVFTEEELKTLIDVGTKEGTLEQSEQNMLYKIFEFSDLHVYDVMRHRSLIKAIPSTLSYKELVHKFTQFGFSRLPVYNGSIENITGILYYKRLLFSQKKERCENDFIKNNIEPALFVPERSP